MYILNNNPIIIVLYYGKKCFLKKNYEYQPTNSLLFKRIKKYIRVDWCGKIAGKYNFSLSIHGSYRIFKCVYKINLVSIFFIFK